MTRILLISMVLMSNLVNGEDKIDDQTVMISEQDFAMQIAIETARKTLGDFFSVVAMPPEGATDFRLKVIVSDENGTEHLWFSPFGKVEGGFAGVLANDPITITSMSYGKVYGFKESQITDWGYVLNGKQVGSYTVCALFLTMDKDVVARYKEDYGFECKATETSTVNQ